MELRHLKYFVAVAEELHFGRAARRLHIAQPPLSQQIRQLEDELGIRLLERTSRKVGLTSEGELFLDEARKVLAGLDRAVERVRNMAHGGEGNLSIGFLGPAALSVLPEAIREFREQNPGIRLDLTSASTRDQLRMLRSGRIDVAFMRLFGHDASEFRTRLFVSDTYMLAVPEGHRFSALESVPLSELRDEPLILYPRHLEPQLFDATIACFHQAGFSPNIVQEANTEQTSMALVAAGLGCALVARFSRKSRLRGVSFVPVVGELPSWEITMGWSEAAEGPILDRFFEVIERYRRV
ncbi:LysR substrate-binding domain-containing protein [Salidesulfovibrio onnuriiensis]|uniref:LysR substrate-binding domain-containing protein n=1 Tax=Salidesulfovibrio onnuriiensis TaxID=2583823 RepID=UPI0011C8B821|nr:LysR substrate-binding domain-containing protein [Salidesulfovibrio onnuriiensis]